MEKKKEYKEERFEFAIYVNDNVICKRNFRIFNYIENSMNTLEFKEAVDGIVRMIDNDLKSKSRVYTWFHFNPDYPDAADEFNSPTIEPWACTFKFVVSDNKKPMLTKIWDGYAYPKAIRDKVDLGNKNVKITSRDGQTYIYDKESFFKSNEGRLSFEQEVLRAMIMDKADVLSQITRRICEACSPTKDEIKDSEKGYFTPRDSAKYLEKYTVSDEYGNGRDDEYPRKYLYSLFLTNRRAEREWERATANKTKKYFRNLY